MNYDDTLALITSQIPALAALATTHDGAEELLHHLTLTHPRSVNLRANVLNDFFAEYGDVVFPSEIGDTEVLLCKIQFNEPWSFTMLYEFSEDGYSALGMEFAYSKLKVDRDVDVQPWRAIAYGRSLSIPDNIRENGLLAIYRYVGQFYDDSSDAVPTLPTQPSTTRAQFPDGYFVTSPIEPLLVLKDMELEYGAFKVIMNMVNEYSEITHDHIFGRPIDSQYDIVTPRFKLQSSYSNSEDNWNFIWRDVNIQWYKHAGRCLVINRPLTAAELSELLFEVTDVFKTYPFKKTPIRYNEPMSPEDMLKVGRRLELNGISGSFGTYPKSVLTRDVRTDK